MRVFIDARPLIRGGGSGIPVYAQELLTRLLKQPGITCDFFYPGMRNKLLPEAIRGAENASVRRLIMPNRLLDITTRFFSVPDISHHFIADVVFSPHLNNLIPGKLPRVLTVHDLSFAHHPYFFSIRQRYWHFMQQWKKQITSAQHIIAVSNATKADIIKTLAIPEDRITVTYPGVSTDLKPLDIHDARLLNYQKKNALHNPYVLYLGSFEKRKNLELLISALELLRTNPRFKEIELVLAGAPGFGAHKLLQRIRSSKSARHIRILSRVTDEERILLYNGAIAFVYPSLFEGFGFPPLEAQACGVPTIVSKRTSLTEITQGSALAVNPWKPAELSDALSSLVVDGNLRQTMRRQGLENVKRFSWEQAASQTADILSRIALRNE